jgi:hypothetical protein
MSELLIKDYEVAEQQIVYLVAKDTAPDLEIRFDGLDLSDYTTLQMLIRYDTGARLAKTITPDGTDDELGTVTWSSGDLIIGVHKAEFALDTNTLPKRFPVLLKIRKDLG